MLIRNADLLGGGGPDLRVIDGRIAAIGRLAPRASERLLEADGGALLPGLHDHHIHLLSYAAAFDSVPCGPPNVNDADELVAALAKARPNRTGWIRGIGYHDSIAGAIDRSWLDRHAPPLPVRIQHRSGRLWIVNSPGLEILDDALRAARLTPQEHSRLQATNGRIYDADALLRTLLPSTLPDVRGASERLAARGVTGVTDMTPDNASPSARLFASLQARGRLLQDVYMAGVADLRTETVGVRLGPTKVHLHDTALPPFNDLCKVIHQSHLRERNVAFHCVTETELVFALAALREAHPHEGDRIEHAAVTPPELLEQLGELGLIVVTQPHFVTERGDAYLRDVDASERRWLYRCRTLLDAGVRLAGGTDAPFGGADPWSAMHAAVTRRTANGRTLGPGEALSPEQALDLFLGAPDTPATPRELTVGASADLCLLGASWSVVRGDLSKASVRATLRGGVLIHDGVDQTPL